MGVHGAVNRLKRLRFGTFAAALAVLAFPAHTLASSRLLATVRSNGSTSLVDGGSATTSLRHGRYVFVIRDLSRSCGFRLTGASGVVAATRARFVGTATRRVVLAPGTYTYSCGARHRHTLRVT